MKRLMLPFVFVFAAAVAAAQQPAEQPAVPDESLAISVRPPVIEVQRLVLDYISAPEGTPTGLLGSLMKMYRRDLYVKNRDGSVTGPVHNWDDVGSAFLVYDTQEYVDELKTAVTRALAAVPRLDSPALRIATYTPRSVDVNRLAEALEPLRRQVFVSGPPNVVRPEMRHNLSFQSSPSLLSIQDTPDQVDRMLALLAQVDQPPPQFLIQGLVIGTSMKAAGPTDAPPELVENLKRLLPYQDYQVLGTVLVQASMEPGEEQQLAGRLSNNEPFEIVLQPAAVDLARGRVTMKRLRFDSNGQSFETSAVIGLDDYAVIGGAGANPKLVVLRLKSLTTK